MATVVQVPRDTRYGDVGRGLGVGITRFFDRRKKNRLDALQTELMQTVANAEDEFEAIKTLGDPRYEELVTDPQRFAIVNEFLNKAQPGSEIRPFFDIETGELRPLPVKKGTVLSDEELLIQNVRRSPNQPFFVVDKSDPTSVPTLLSIFPNRAEALKDLGAFSERTGTNIGDLEVVTGDAAVATLRENARVAIQEAQTETQFSLQRDRLVNETQRTLYDKMRTEYTLNRPFDAVAQLHSDRVDGKLGADALENEANYQSRLEVLTTITGMSAQDFTKEMKTKLVGQEVAIHVFTDTVNSVIQRANEGVLLGSPASFGIFLVETVAAVKGVANLINQVPAERRRQILERESVDKVISTFTANAAEAKSMKGLIMDLAILLAASRGTTGRAFSDKDFDRYLDRVGANTNDPTLFVVNLADLLQQEQRNFRTAYSTIHGNPYEGRLQSPLGLGQQRVKELRGTIEKRYNLTPLEEKPGD